MCRLLTETTRTIVKRLSDLPRRVHSDERGTISIITVFTLLMFTMLLVMIVNVGTHVDDKLKMQNAADASTYSGGVVLTRGMNGVAFTNQLLSDVFAMTAFLREARDRNAESVVPPILAAWQTAGSTLSSATFPPFQELGQAIQRKVPREEEAVEAYGELGARAAELTLPVFEHILAEELITEFQREVMATVPEVAQAVTDEVARRHGLLGPSGSNGSGSSRFASEYEQKRGRQYGVLWRTNVMPVALADESDPLTRTLPIVDPSPTGDDFHQLVDADVYLQVALIERRNRAKDFLNQWNFDRLRLFTHEGKMSTFFPLWRMATCAQLDQLLNIEYPISNVPMQLRRTLSGDAMEDLIVAAERLDEEQPLNRRNDYEYPWVMDNLRRLIDVNDYVSDNFHYVGVVYRRHRNEIGPGLFRNPLAATSDAQTFSQIYMFVPRPRKRKVYAGEGGGSGDGAVSLGGTFGFTSTLPIPGDTRQTQRPPEAETLERVLRERWILENWPTHWNLMNQNWMVQLVPATTDRLPEILAANPGGELSNVRTPTYSGVDSSVLKRVNTH